MKRFTPEQLERAIDLYEHVEVNRRDVPNMHLDDLQLHCEFWTFKARALLEDSRLPQPDHLACLWVLGVTRAIARQAGINVHGLSRDHSDDWASRARSAAKRILARMKRAETAPARKPKARTTDDSTPEASLSVGAQSASVPGAQSDGHVVTRRV